MSDKNEPPKTFSDWVRVTIDEHGMGTVEVWGGDWLSLGGGCHPPRAHAIAQQIQGMLAVFRDRTTEQRAVYLAPDTVKQLATIAAAAGLMANLGDGGDLLHVAAAAVCAGDAVCEQLGITLPPTQETKP